MAHTKDYEVIIIGGSYAGLSAAMALGRSLRKTLVIDAGKACNRQTPHSHNFLTQDGSTPQEIATISRSQVAKYKTVTFYEGLVITATKLSEGFEVITGNGDVFYAKKLVIATGIRDLMPGIEGFAECWGISVVHCPYCHGYEIRGKKTAILANGDTAFHLASLVNNLSKKLTIITSEDCTFDELQFQKLNKNGIKIIEKEISTIEHDAGHLKYIRFKDGSREAFDAAYAAIPFEQNSIPVELGCQLTEFGYIEVDLMGKTSVKGVLACGDNSSMMRSVAIAVYSGNVAGAVVNHELTQEAV
ncbi:NAD(P)/FAD-dependent oxidoreductase [uncultured Cyclobacterium sp.]|mgnify:CR=1 FL=1|uniref:NAD(P)/FAD-dependent oxidoreductase n=1 Tax=uncultured Cyclobacterium sp. TaxID=453820 RepID=UPI0030EF506E|tara:strand:+ start:78934 stop:79839 length:906 start_codon:yes stop_codon:yes gene_type:complete